MDMFSKETEERIPKSVLNMKAKGKCPRGRSG
jgi:hypothetical protein